MLLPGILQALTRPGRPPCGEMKHFISSFIESMSEFCDVLWRIKQIKKPLILCSASPVVLGWECCQFAHELSTLTMFFLGLNPVSIALHRLPQIVVWWLWCKMRTYPWPALARLTRVDFLCTVKNALIGNVTRIDRIDLFLGMLTHAHYIYLIRKGIRRWCTDLNDAVVRLTCWWYRLCTSVETGRSLLLF